MQGNLAGAPFFRGSPELPLFNDVELDGVLSCFRVLEIKGQVKLRGFVPAQNPGDNETPIIERDQLLVPVNMVRNEIAFSRSQAGREVVFYVAIQRHLFALE